MSRVSSGRGSGMDFEKYRRAACLSDEHRKVP